MSRSYSLSIAPRRAIVWLGSIVVALLAVHVLLQVTHYEWHQLPWLLRQIFDVDEEDSLPTWYAASLLLFCFALLLAISLDKRADGDPWSRHWFGLSFVFLALSVDEVAGLHETLNSLIDFSWAIPGGVAAIAFGLAYVRFLLHLPRRTAALFAMAGAIFLAGAVGVELATEGYADEDLLDTLAYNLWTAVEEGLEMGGVVLFLHALLGYMGEGGSARLELRVDGP